MKGEAVAYCNYIGMTVDEVNRAIRRPGYSYPLIPWGWTAEMCLKYLKKQGIPHTIYDRGFKRLGCIYCPNMSNESLYIIFRDYPDIWEQLLQYEEESPRPMRGRNTGKKSLVDLQDEFEERKKKEKHP